MYSASSQIQSETGRQDAEGDQCPGAQKSVSWKGQSHRRGTESREASGGCKDGYGRDRGNLDLRRLPVGALDTYPYEQRHSAVQP